MTPYNPSPPDDKIGILTKDVAESSSAKQAFRTVSATLTLVRVSILVPHSASTYGLSLIPEPGQANRLQRSRATVRILLQCTRGAEDRNPGWECRQRIREVGTQGFGKVR